MACSGRPNLGKSEQDYLKLLERAARWQQQFADSATPRIVAAGLWEQMAITRAGRKARSFAVNVTPEGWRFLFNERMAKAEAFLEEAETAFRRRSGDFITAICGPRDSPRIRRATRST